MGRLVAQVPPQAWLAGLAVLIGLGVALAISTLWPGEVEERALRGYRAEKRQRGMTANGLLRLIWPLAVTFSYYARFVPDGSLRRGIAEKLRDAGEPLGLSVDEFLGLNLAVAVALGGVGATVCLVNGWSPLLALPFFFLGLVVPHGRLADLIKVRFKALNRGLPPAIDVVVMAMAAGLDFVNALGYLLGKWSNKRDPLFEELSRFHNDLLLGKTRREALLGLAERAPTDLVKTFCGSVIEAEQRGTPLNEALAIQAEVARTRRFQRAEQAAGRAGVLIKLPLVLVMLACLLVMVGPLLVKAVRGELF
jgi:tight adherence protein C